MTLFSNIHIGAEVDVARHGSVCLGKVKWKGNLVTKTGDWIGIQLYKPVGCHSGMFKGRRYFECTDGYGIFVRPWQIRFRTKNQRSYNSYYTLSKESFCDETLFSRNSGNSAPKVKNGFSPSEIPKLYAKNAAESFQEKPIWSDVRNFHLKHSVGANMLPASYRPQTGNAENVGKSRTPMSLNEYYNDKDGIKDNYSTIKHSSPVSFRETYIKNRRHSYFITPPSIPMIHKPSSSKLAW